MSFDFDELKKKLYLDRHHKMERFSIVFLSLCALMIITLAGGFMSYVDNSKVTIADQAIYNDTFVTSLSAQEGHIVNVYTSKDKTRAFVLLKRENVGSMSTDANDYQVFVTYGSQVGNPQGFRSVPAGAFYMFGSTGYYGVYLVDREGFRKQVLDIIIREDTELTDKQDEAISDYADDDASFSQFDQTRIYVNPGATKTQYAKVLDQEGAPSVMDIYSQTVSRAAQAEIEKQLDEDLATMKKTLAQIDEYTRRLEREGVIVPEAPVYVGSDSITEDKDGNLKLETSYTLPSGFDFDWRQGDISTGWLQSLKTAEDTSDEAFFQRKRREGQQAKDEQASQPDQIEWRMTDGTAVKDLDTGSGKDRYSVLQAAIDDLTSAWSEYLSEKQAYQIDHLGALLELEALQNTVPRTSTINDDAKAFTVYER